MMWSSVIVQASRSEIPVSNNDAVAPHVFRSLCDVKVSKHLVCILGLEECVAQRHGPGVSLLPQKLGGTSLDRYEMTPPPAAAATAF